jgi:hypothetical protein
MGILRDRPGVRYMCGGRNSSGPVSSISIKWQVLPCGRVKHACKYRFYSEFQSHEGEFDYLKSLEIEEKINTIKWCRRTNGARFLLSSNGTCPVARFTSSYGHFHSY